MEAKLKESLIEVIQHLEFARDNLNVLRDLQYEKLTELNEGLQSNFIGKDLEKDANSLNEIALGIGKSIEQLNEL